MRLFRRRPRPAEEDATGLGLDVEFEDHGRRRKVFVVLGLVLALVAGGAAFFLISQAQAAPPTLAMRDIIVATRDVPARTALAASDLTTRQVPDDPSLAQAITDPNQVVGRITSVPLLFQQPILPNLLLANNAGGFSILGPDETLSPDAPQWRAVGLNVPDDRAVGGQIQPDQRVDIFVTAQVNVVDPEADVSGPGTGPVSPDGGVYYTDKSTKVTYQNVQVLAKNGLLYVIKVDEKTAEEISHLQAAGNAMFSLALRPDGDKREIDTAEYGETTNSIIEEKGLPIPEVYPNP